MKYKKECLLLCGILFGAVVLNLYGLTKTSLWHDEAFSMLLPRYGFVEMIRRAGLDVHPPLYYILLRPWLALLSESLFSLRAFSALFSLLSTLSIYFFVKKTFKNNAAALLSAALFAFSSFQIQYAREGRMYSLGTFFVIASTWVLTKALKSNSWKTWTLYSLLAVAGMYTHYYVIFSVAGQALFAAYWIISKNQFNVKKILKSKALRLGLFCCVLITLIFAPWLPSFVRQVSQVQENYWIPPMNKWSIPATIFKMLVGKDINIHEKALQVLMITIIISLLNIIFLIIKKIKSQSKWLMILLFFTPFLGAVLLSFKRAIYLDRYFIFCQPFLAIIIALAVMEIKNRSTRNAIVIILILFTVLSFPLHWQRLKVAERPGIKPIAEYLNKEVETDHGLYVGSSFVYFIFQYYNETGINPLLYADGPLSHFSGTALLDEQNMVRSIALDSKKYNTVWMLNTTGYGNYQPEIPDSWEKIEEKAAEDIGNRGWIIATKYRVE